MRDVHRAAQRIEITDERLRNGASASARNRPAHCVNGDAEHQADGRAQRPVEAQARVARQSCKDGARARIPELASRKALRGFERGQPESRHPQRMMRNAQHWPEAVFRKLLPVIDGGLHQAPPRLAILAQRAFRFAKVALQHHRGAIVERVRQRRFAMNPLQSKVRQRQRSEKRRTRRERMHRRAEVVHETRAA